MAEHKFTLITVGFKPTTGIHVHYDFVAHKTVTEYLK